MAPKHTPAIDYGKNIKKPRGSKAECKKKTNERSRYMAINSLKCLDPTMLCMRNIPIKTE